jgi:hypothetical protein
MAVDSRLYKLEFARQAHVSAENDMTVAPKEIDVIRRAYERWQLAGQPSGKDDDFYYAAKKELQEALDKQQGPHSD